MRKLFTNTAKTEGTLVSLPELQVDKHVKHCRSGNIVKIFHVLFCVVLFLSLSILTKTNRIKMD